MALSMERLTETLGPMPSRGTYPIAANTRIFKGSQVGINSSGQAIAATTIAAGCVRVVGKSSATYDNRTGSALGGAAAAVDVDVEYGVFNWANSAGADEIALDDVGKICYAVDDQTVALTSNGGLRPIAGLISEFKSPTYGGTAVPYVWQNPVVPVFYDTLTTLASTANAEGAALIGIEDAGTFTAATTVEAALAELYQDRKAATASKEVQFTAGILAAGTPMAAFADNAGASAPGVTLVDSKCMGIRWNNHANQVAVFTRFDMPDDIDITANASLKFLVSKSGATVGDAVKMTVACFNNVAGVAHDVDGDFGGDTGALVGNALAKTITELSLTLTAANLAAAGSGVTMSFKPKDGTLGTDDAICTGIRLVYKRKPLTA